MDQDEEPQMQVVLHEVFVHCLAAAFNLQDLGMMYTDINTVFTIHVQDNIG